MPAHPPAQVSLMKPLMTQAREKAARIALDLRWHSERLDFCRRKEKARGRAEPPAVGGTTTAALAPASRPPWPRSLHALSPALAAGADAAEARVEVAGQARDADDLGDAPERCKVRPP